MTPGLADNAGGGGGGNVGGSRRLAEVDNCHPLALYLLETSVGNLAVLAAVRTICNVSPAWPAPPRWSHHFPRDKKSQIPGVSTVIGYSTGRAALLTSHVVVPFLLEWVTVIIAIVIMEYSAFSPYTFFFAAERSH